MSSNPDPMVVDVDLSAAPLSDLIIATECPVCSERFSSTDPQKNPYILSACGHSICKTCGDLRAGGRDIAAEGSRCVPVQCPLHEQWSMGPLRINYTLVGVLSALDSVERFIAAGGAVRLADSAGETPAGQQPAPVRQAGAPAHVQSPTLDAPAAITTAPVDRILDASREGCLPTAVSTSGCSATRLDVSECLRDMSPEDRAVAMEVMFDEPLPRRPAPAPTISAPARAGRVGGISGSRFLRRSTFRGSDLFERLGGLVTDGEGRIVISDLENRSIRTFDQEGRIVRTIVCKLGKPFGVAVDGRGFIYAACGDQCVQIFNQDGRYIGSFSNFGPYRTGSVSVHGIAIDNNRNVIYVSDAGNNHVHVLDLTGRYTNSFGGKGSGWSQFNQPTAIAVGVDGRIIVVDRGNARVQVFDSSLNFIFVISVTEEGWDRGRCKVTRTPISVAVDNAGTIVVCCESSHYIRMFDSGGLPIKHIDVFGTIDPGSYPLGVAVDGNGRIITCTSYERRISVLSAG